MRFLPAIAILCLVFMGSCRKYRDPEIDLTPPRVPKLGDTIKPLPYFPAFPGSRWKYLNSAGDTVIYYTEPNWQKDAYSRLLNDGTFYRSDTAIVPVYFEKDRIPVWGSRWNLGGNYGIHTVVSDSLGLHAKWSAGQSGSHSGVLAEVTAFDTSMNVLNVQYPHVILIEYRATMDARMGPPFSWRCFAKHVGMILKIENADTLRLVSFSIGK